MNSVIEDDGELADFLEEMRQEEPRLRALLAKGNASVSAEIDLQSARGMVKARNEMAALLREFLARHPEDADLARRARRYI